MTELADVLDSLILRERLKRSAQGMIYRAAKKSGDISVADLGVRLAARNEGLSYEAACGIVQEAAESYCKRSRFYR